MYKIEDTTDADYRTHLSPTCPLCGLYYCYNLAHLDICSRPHRVPQQQLTHRLCSQQHVTQSVSTHVMSEFHLIAANGGHEVSPPDLFWP